MNDLITLSIQGKDFSADLSLGQSLAIPLNFQGPQPSFFQAKPATSESLKIGEFNGNVKNGGACNVESVKATFHTCCTHTECVGHISSKRISISEIIDNKLIPVTVVSVNPMKIGKDTYHHSSSITEQVLTRDTMESVISGNDGFLDAVAIRTLPNDHTKMTRNYQIHGFPYFTNEAMIYLQELKIRHLLVDTPSVDRYYDSGKLGNHRIFWGVKADESEIDPTNCSKRTITEMIYIPESIKDGNYLLNLQVAEFLSDAAPSRPIIYPTNEI